MFAVGVVVVDVGGDVGCDVGGDMMFFDDAVSVVVVNVGDGDVYLCHCCWWCYR